VRFRPPLLLALVLAATGCGDADDADADAGPATPIAVHAAPVVRADLVDEVVAYGRVRGAPGSAGTSPARATIAAPVSAVVREVRCVPGDEVDAGAVLFLLDTRVDDAEVARAEEALSYAEASLHREETLLEQGNSSAQRLEAAQRAVDDASGVLAVARARRSLSRVSTPIAGRVASVRASVGDVVDGSAPLAEVVDTERLVIEASVPPAAAATVQPGQAVRVDAAGAGAVDVRGTVAAVSPAVDAGSGAVPVQIVVDGGGLLPGDFVQAHVAARRRQGVLAVPLVALVPTDEGHLVQVIEDGIVHSLPVEVGVRDGDRVEVAADGLSAGAMVVSVEAYGLPDGQPVELLAESEAP